MIKKIIFGIIFINYIISRVYQNDELEKKELEKLYKESKNLKIRMLKEIKKSKPKKRAKNLKKKRSKKKAKKKSKKRSKKAKKRNLKKKNEIFYLKKLLQVIASPKTKKNPSSSRTLKKNHSKKAVENTIKKKLNKIMLKSKSLPEQDRKLFANAVLDFGLEGITSVLAYFSSRAGNFLSDPNEILQPISFIYFILGIYKYFINKNIQNLKLNVIKVRINSLKAQTNIIEENDHDVIEALYGIKSLQKKTRRINSDSSFRLDSKIELINNLD